MSMK